MVKRIDPTVWRVAPWLLAASLGVGCGGPDRDIHRAFNSRDVGSYVPVGRSLGDDGTLVVHVSASRPENAERIAQHVVRQNYAASADSIRVVVDPMTGDGERRVYRWD